MYLVTKHSPYYEWYSFPVTTLFFSSEKAQAYYRELKESLPEGTMDFISIRQIEPADMENYFR